MPYTHISCLNFLYYIYIHIESGPQTLTAPPKVWCPPPFPRKLRICAHWEAQPPMCLLCDTCIFVITDFPQLPPCFILGAAESSHVVLPAAFGKTSALCCLSNGKKYTSMRVKILNYIVCAWLASPVEGLVPPLFLRALVVKKNK